MGYTHPFTGTVYHLVINQAVEVPALTHHLLAPMQARVNDVKVNDVPSYLTENPTNESYPRITLTSKTLTCWDPSTPVYEEQENAIVCVTTMETSAEIQQEGDL